MEIGEGVDPFQFFTALNGEFVSPFHELAVGETNLQGFEKISVYLPTHTGVILMEHFGQKWIHGKPAFIVVPTTKQIVIQKSLRDRARVVL